MQQETDDQMSNRCPEASLDAVSSILVSLLEGQSQSAFLQMQMLQACLSLMLALLNTPEVQAGPHLQVLSYLLKLDDCLTAQSQAERIQQVYTN